VARPLTTNQKRVAVVVVVAETVSAVLAYRDLAGRADEAVRGPKLLWRVMMALNPGNSLAYWLFGRRSVGRVRRA
jgi:hypothetical protein